MLHAAIRKRLPTRNKVGIFFVTFSFVILIVELLRFYKACFQPVICFRPTPGEPWSLFPTIVAAVVGIIGGICIDSKITDKATNIVFSGAERLIVAVRSGTIVPRRATDPSGVVFTEKQPPPNVEPHITDDESKS